MFGTFDHLHPGHRACIREAMELGDVTIVVARDHNVHGIKGRRSLQSEQERKHALEEAFPEASVILGAESDFLEPVRAVQPDLIALGYDQTLPPSLSEEMLGAPIHRLQPYEPQTHKSSLHRARTQTS